MEELTAVDRKVAPYDAERDLAAVQRIWREVGWVDGEERRNRALESFLAASHGEVGLLDGHAECLVLWCDGKIHYQAIDLGLCMVAAVTTSLVGRKQGFATQLTAEALATGAAAGHAVAALGMFEQGFYDRLGFGTGSYVHRFKFDPATLRVEAPARSPVRLSPDDWGDVHAAMVGRRRTHGGVVIDDPVFIKAELEAIEKFFGLGFRDDAGRLTHFVIGEINGAHGPLDIAWLAYETPDQLLELLRLLHELGDQLHSVRFHEPPDLQLQDLLATPVRSRRALMVDGRYPTDHHAFAYWQIRMLDVVACVAANQWPGPELAFDLVLSDPLDEKLSGAWRGVGGNYTVTVGSKSHAEPGHRGGLPVLHASVNAFSRMWFAVRPASSLSLTDDLAGPPELLAALDECLRLPSPVVGWEF